VQLCCLTFASATAAPAQGLNLPPIAPLNPEATDRTGLYAAPYDDPSTGTRFLVSLEYGSAIEREYEDGGRYLLDGEFLRLALRARRDIGKKTFVDAWVGVRGNYDGWGDEFLNWVHDRLGVSHQGRQNRPLNVYADSLWFYSGTVQVRGTDALYLDDLRLGIGYRHNRYLQSLFSLTLPTTTAGDYGKRVPSFNLIETLRFPVFPIMTFEGSAGVGFTPTYGELSPYQREVFGSASAGLRLRLFDGQSIYARAFYHSAIYHDAPVQELNREYLSLDFGWIARTHGGHDIRFGIVEDVHNKHDLAIDVIAMLGYTF
jgi:hypothetical protein